MLVIIAIGLFSFVVWLREGIVNARWAVDIVGGDAILASSVKIAPQDMDFMMSLRGRQTSDEALTILSQSACLDLSVKCKDQNLAIANIIAMSGRDFQTAIDTIEVYSSIDQEGCPIRSEISRLVYHTSYLAANPSKHAANDLLAKIKAKGGTQYSILTENCQRDFAESPYLAKAYLLYISILMGMSDFSPESSWLYLFYRSDGNAWTGIGGN